MIKATINLVSNTKFSAQAPALDPHPVKKGEQHKSLIEVTMACFHVGKVEVTITLLIDSYFHELSRMEIVPISNVAFSL